MADELIQAAGIFQGMTWWNTNQTKNILSTGGLSPYPYCSMAIGGQGFGAVELNSNFFENPPMGDSSTFEAMGFGSTGWNLQDLIHGGSSNGDYITTTTVLQAEETVNPTTILQSGEWRSTCGGGSKDLSCSSSPSTVMNSAGNSSATEGSTITGDGQIPVTSSFPVDSSSLFPRLLNGDFGIKSSNDHEILPPCNWNGSQVLGSSFSQQRQQQILNDIRATLLGGSPSSSSPSSPQSQPRKIIHSKVNRKEGVCASGSVASRSGTGEPSFKRQRLETPSSLPTFKVRKEKLGDRITALQQLVSPFGKTDTASVLHEAIEYIKFLHDQVNVLSTPYMKNGAPNQHHLHQVNYNQKPKTHEEGPNQDLKSRGLCLVPISSTFPVAHETTADFWTPTFGASFR